MTLAIGHGLQASPRAASGFTLVELMIALALGLVVTGAALSMFMTNKGVYATTENLGRAQESARTAYELMARDMRDAASNPCETGLPTVNVLKNPAANWWSNFDGGLRGYDGATAFADAPFGTGPKARIAGTHALELKAAINDGVTIVSHNPTSAQFKVNTVDHGLADGDIAVACDFDHAAIFQVSNAQPGINDTVVHNSGTGSPGNCSKGLGYSNPVDCSTNGAAYAYGPNSVIARVRMERWYVGNGATGPALFQSVLANKGGVLQVEQREIAEGVRDMRLQYLLDNATDYVDATSLTSADWNSSRVVAVRVALSIEGRNGNDKAAPVPRKFEHTVTLRNRVP